jgi:predicted alpha/beta-hydrolase family hydrolase
VLEPRDIALEGGQSVSAIVAFPERHTPRARTTVVLAHGAGNDMHGAFLSAVHEGLAARGFVTVKFNFPYKQRGGRVPDPAPVLERCYVRILDMVRSDSRLAVQRIVIGGKSLGGRMASHLAARGEAVAGVLLLGYPLHPPGKPNQLRVAHLDKIQAPMLFFAGTRDALCQLDLLRQTISRLRTPTELHIIEGGDHSFNVLKSLRREPAAVWDEIIETSARWLDRLAG